MAAPKLLHFSGLARHHRDWVAGVLPNAMTPSAHKRQLMELETRARLNPQTSLDHRTICANSRRWRKRALQPDPAPSSRQATRGRNRASPEG
jgi:hypothetical protein